MTTEDLTGGGGGTRVVAGTRVRLLAGAEDRSEPRLVITHSGLTIPPHSDSAQPTDGGGWLAKEHRTLLDAVRPGGGGGSRQLGVYANMQGDCRKQLGHIKKRVKSGISCLAARGSAKFAEVLLVTNAAILKQAGYYP